MNVNVHISDLAYRKIMHWVRKAGRYEVSGFGNVVFDKENNTFLVTDAYLLEQENTGTTTDIKDTAIGKLMYEHHKSKVKGELRFWWHSHAGMDVFWSGTDLETIEKLAQGGWFLSTVFNLKEEMRSAIYTTEPVPAFEDELDTTVLYSVDEKAISKALAKLGFKLKKGAFSNFLWTLEADVEEAEVEAWDKEYDDKVSVKKYTPPVAGRGFFSHLPLGDDSDIADDDDDFKSVMTDSRGTRMEDLDEEDIDEIYEEMEAYIRRNPDCTSSDIIAEFEEEYPYISMFIPVNIKSGEK